VFLGPESAGRERVQVWHPCVSTLFSTTPDGLKTSISREFVVQGFLPRCIIFHDAEYGEIGDPRLDETALQAVTEGFQDIQRMKPAESAGARNLVSPRPSPVEIAVSEDAKAMLAAYARECAEKLAASDAEEIDRHFLSRAAQQAGKLSLIQGALWRSRVGTEDVEWAIETLAACRYNASPILPQVGAENVQETNVMRVYQIIKSEGTVYHSRLIGRTRFLRTNERHEILASLEAEGKIRGSVNDNRAKVWSVI
jgi:hypothetical protein